MTKKICSTAARGTHARKTLADKINRRRGVPRATRLWIRVWTIKYFYGRAVTVHVGTHIGVFDKSPDTFCCRGNRFDELVGTAYDGVKRRNVAKFEYDFRIVRKMKYANKYCR